MSPAAVYVWAMAPAVLLSPWMVCGSSHASESATRACVGPLPPTPVMMIALYALTASPFSPPPLLLHAQVQPVAAMPVPVHRYAVLPAVAEAERLARMRPRRHSPCCWVTAGLLISLALLAFGFGAGWFVAKAEDGKLFPSPSPSPTPSETASESASPSDSETPYFTPSESASGVCVKEVERDVM